MPCLEQPSLCVDLASFARLEPRIYSVAHACMHYKIAIHVYCAVVYSNYSCITNTAVECYSTIDSIYKYTVYTAVPKALNEYSCTTTAVE